MKKRWICFLIALFLFTALPVSAEGNPPPVTLSVEEMTVNPGTDTVEVSFYYDTAEYLMDGGFLVTFPADKLQLLLEGMNGPTNPASPYIFLPGGTFSAVFAPEGRFFIAFVDSGTTFEPGKGLIAKLPFKILDPAVGGDYTVSIKADRLTKWVEGVAAGENLVSDETPIEASGIVHVVPDPNATHTTTTAPTERYTSSPFDTTSIPTETTTSVVTTEPPTTSTTQTTTSIPTTQETTTTTSTVVTTGSEIATTTTELPTASQTEKVADTAGEPTKTDTFPWWAILLAAAVAGAAVLIPLAIKLRKT